MVVDKQVNKQRDCEKKNIALLTGNEVDNDNAALVIKKERLTG